MVNKQRSKKSCALPHRWQSQHKSQCKGVDVFHAVEGFECVCHKG